MRCFGLQTAKLPNLILLFDIEFEKIRFIHCPIVVYLFSVNELCLKLCINTGVLFLPEVQTQGPINNVSIIKNYDKTQALYPRNDI